MNQDTKDRLVCGVLAIALSMWFGLSAATLASRVMAEESEPTYALVLTLLGHEFVADYGLTIDDCVARLDESPRFLSCEIEG